MAISARAQQGDAHAQDIGRGARLAGELLLGFVQRGRQLGIAGQGHQALGQVERGRGLLQRWGTRGRQVLQALLAQGQGGVGQAQALHHPAYHALQIGAQAGLGRWALAQLAGAAAQPGLDALAAAESGIVGVQGLGLEEAGQIVAAGLGPGRGLARPLGLPQGQAQAGAQGQHHRAGRSHRPAVAAQGPGRRVPALAAPGLQGAALQMAANIFGKGLGRGVARRGIGRHGLAHDGVQIAGQGAPPRRRGLAAGRGHAQRGQLLLQRRGRAAVQAVGALAAEQLVEHHAQGIDIGAHRQGLAGQLLGRGHIGGQGLRAGLGRVQQAGDAEVQQLHLAALVHQDIARLEVAVDDQAAVGEGHGREHLQKERQHPGRRPGLARHPLVDGLAVHLLHGQIGLALGAEAGVVEPRDMRVLQTGQQIALVDEALAHALRRLQLAQRQLQGHAAQHAAGLLGGPDHGHAALAQRRQQAVVGDAVTGAQGRGALGGQGLLQQGGGRAVERRALLVRLQQGLQRRQQLGLGGGQGLQTGGALGRGQGHQRVELRGEARPELGRDLRRAGAAHGRS